MLGRAVIQRAVNLSPVENGQTSPSNPFQHDALLGNERMKLAIRAHSSCLRAWGNYPQETLGCAN